ncbi:MAG: twitching motility protein PilT [Candidatus Raymondbacteria bacterium RifOxyA12_full_50_37]|uniref:Twitching motility protein PilT n=1 Tax=Candidatus Raymondbacteria bacterium RIFOXYD12_FULL_49_13 TaxID=1817890 RepID=A0A1F7F2P0_UNCRA|nr:MAG: twitching motility protein PilT [Candidatus Raymondbacteria bacterium RifOxyA12_full_50_37]OGJ87807.1 MAG: twitching motility protein PilT [Candidatus Raymondbacteria bacterium RifOxyB12_full_50_8]OGJ88661.1 MAG: twitching motility protein PilT [Candidatus Raymondbacteria bacterium RIFOXYA2_FULL_49_16]OGK00833.1 MAG: twitching motility protein PilT [Candidatus Raymondbacteria bacterium RIFOXYD12_FULL_49_13]OGK02864.1 MAG: twitching motility protein PilT [Candidatus Raymondbacteria bacte
MIFDTDILIWIQRGNEKAAAMVDADTDRFISIITYMELLQKANNREQQAVIKDYLTQMDFTVLPLSENIGHRASIYVEEYALSHGISADDALIAATAIENNQSLVSGNNKHYKAIKDLHFKRFQV